MHLRQPLIQVAYIDGRVFPYALPVNEVPARDDNEHTQYLDQFLRNISQMNTWTISRRNNGARTVVILLPLFWLSSHVL